MNKSTVANNQNYSITLSHALLLAIVRAYERGSFAALDAAIQDAFHVLRIPLPEWAKPGNVTRHQRREH